MLWMKGEVAKFVGPTTVDMAGPYEISTSVLSLLGMIQFHFGRAHRHTYLSPIANL